MAESSTRKAVRRRMFVNLALGSVALGAAAILITPKVIALLDGSLQVVGVGALANLALLFGGLMFLREGVRCYRDARRSSSQRVGT